jgi:hypothetical protein
MGQFREHSGNIQGTFREHSGNIQGTFREYSGTIQATGLFVVESAEIVVGEKGQYAGGDIQGTFRERSGNIQGTFREHAHLLLRARRSSWVKRAIMRGEEA